MEGLIQAINQVLEGKGLPPIASIHENIHLRNDLGFDSFDLAELTVRIEEHFQVDVFSEGIVNTVGEIQQIIEKSAA